MAVENLSEMFEKPTDQLAGKKVEILDKTAYCFKRKNILLNTTADELKAGKSLPVNILHGSRYRG